MLGLRAAAPPASANSSPIVIHMLMRNLVNDLIEFAPQRFDANGLNIERVCISAATLEVSIIRNNLHP